MGEQEHLLVRLGQLLTQIARPHRLDEQLPVDLQTSLWQLGVPCDGSTPREELVARLWARKRTVLEMTPPSAA